MPFRWSPHEHLALARYLVKWLLLAIPAGALIGAAVALFLRSLDLATSTRWNHPWLLFLLPLAGVAVGLMYHLFGQSVEGGNNLIMDQIHEPGAGVPSRMAPLVLVGTVITHLFGGSAGREGTAVQMGGSLASTAGRWLRLDRDDTRTLLMAGVAAGFGAVFGTPLTGAVFAVEVLAIGRVNFESIVPCLIGSVAGDWATRACGATHTRFHLSTMSPAPLGSGSLINWALLGKVAIAGAAFGLVSVLFAELTHGLQRLFKRVVPWSALRPAVGGLIVIALAGAVGSDYLGLGVVADPHHPAQVSIVSSFSPVGAKAWSWWWKILFTAVTLGSGFKGGEVTPLFFIGASLGNTLSRVFHAPTDLFAALGFVGVFAGATNTPLACTLMGIELFSAGQPDIARSGFVIYLAMACFVSYLMSGHSGIYLSQRVSAPKAAVEGLEPDASLRTVRESRPRIGSI